MADVKQAPTALIIMDGFGLAPQGPGNAISLAQSPFFDHAWENLPHTKLEASGQAVGLPAGQMGNSEVGHLNIGAGRVVHQELSRINNACSSGEIEQNQVLCHAFDAALKPGAVLHIMGLLSDGGVHSNNAHLYALLRMACKREVPQVFVHCFMDGRDVPPASGLSYIQELETVVAELAAEFSQTSIMVGSISGRYYAMDRDNRWSRVEKAYLALAAADPAVEVTPDQFMTDSYDAGVTDEFVVPGAFQTRGVKDGDAVVFFNFRPDRAREITRAFVDTDFSGFERGQKLALSYVCLTEYDPTIDAPIAFPKEFPENVLADVLADSGLKQYHIAETEKYAHVTFFLNGGREAPKKNETRQLIKSPAVATYDLQPEMSAYLVTDDLEAAILNDEADFYVVNFANCDMVGHTGVIEAAVAAVEAVDSCVERVIKAIEQKGGAALLTADHGNADKMIAEDGSPHTAHTTALVPLILFDYTGQDRQLLAETGALCNIAPTLLEIMNIRQPKEMTAKSLLA